MVYQIAILLSHPFLASLRGLIKMFIDVYVLWIWEALRLETHSNLNEKKGSFPSTWY